MTSIDRASLRDRIVEEASCPRCGHPQRGALHPESSSWPLVTACSECGLAICWGEYVESQFDLPVYWAEHAPWRRCWAALPLTVLASLVGWPLWTRLRLAHPPRLGRLIAAVIALHLGLLLSVVALHANRSLAVATRMPFRSSPDVIMLRDVLGQTVLCRATWREPSPWEKLVALKPLITRPLSQTPMTVDSWFDVGRRLEARRDWGLQAADVEIDLPAPFGSTLPSRVAFDAAAAAAAGLGAFSTMPSPREFWRTVGDSLRFPFGFATSLAVFGTATFIALPIARHRAKVRWVHVVRAGMYALLGPAALTIGLLWLLGIGSPQATRDLANLLRFTVFLGPCLLLHGVWWWLAAGSYLRMSRPLAVAASVAVIAVLGATAIAVEIL